MYNPQLDTFIAVADSGSFSKAAEKLFISPTAVIKQINLLESDLGFPLFVRTHRGIELTESGKSFYNDVKYFIQYAKESIIRAKNAGNKIDNVIRIGTSLMTPSQFILGIWPSVQQYCPNLKFKLVLAKSTHRELMEENVNIFGFKLSDEDMKKIATLDKKESSFFNHYNPEAIEMLASLVRNV